MATNALSPEDDLVADIHRKLGSGEITATDLETDNRVLARITDGIYRSPAAAIRELVANAYDADATTVTIEMNPPWFDRIVVRDDGEGMDAEALVRLIKHIGGSSKRTGFGKQFGTTAEDPNLSPHGRQLIGRIGIGLFSVAQITKHFQIVTKKSGKDFRLLADVVLDSYNEDSLAEQKDAARSAVTTGRVTIQSVPASDLQSHGTDVVLLDIGRQAMALLTSSEDRDEKDYTFHIGVADPLQLSTYSVPPKLPWQVTDEPVERFRQLAEAVSRTSGKENAAIEKTFDKYLQVVWNLALSVPLSYLDGTHPFDLTGAAAPRMFELSNEPKGPATEITLLPHESLRSRLSLTAPKKGTRPFGVILDGIELRRPIRFVVQHESPRPEDRPLLFVGSWSPPLDRVPAATAGGRELSFEGYFLWSPKVIPTENIGVLIRIADASGILFDRTFMNYPIAEMQRLRQTSAEVFVHRGLDAALNIDRESFNNGHPHTKLVRYWVHQAFRQLATTQKRIAAEESAKRKELERTREADAAENVVNEKLAATGANGGVEVEISDAPLIVQTQRLRGTLAYEEGKVLENVKRDTGKGSKERKLTKKGKLKAIARLLGGFGALDHLDFSRQQDLLNGIARIVWGSADE